MTASRKPVPARRSAASPARVEAHCPSNDCDREKARAMTRLADVAEAFHVEFHELKPTLKAIGEIAGKWLQFCAFIRKWFPRLWMLAPLVAGALFKGSSEATDALIQAVTAYLTLQSGGG